MALVLFSNFGSTAIAGPITNIATSVNLESGAGALFPSPSNGQYFTAEFNDQATGLDYEIIHVTGRSVDTLTIVRAQEGTTALNWNTGDLFFSAPTAGTMALFQQVLTNAGNPNGNVAGTAASLSPEVGPTLCWDTVNNIYWYCSATGSSSTAVWLPLQVPYIPASNLVFYVSNTGSDVTGNGTSGNPWATLNHAFNFAQQNYNLVGQFTVTINVLTNLTTPMNVTGLITGQVGSGSIIINFTNATTFQTTNNNCITANNGAQFTVQCSGGTVVLETTGSASGVGDTIQANGGSSTITLGVGISLGACYATQITATQGGLVNISQNLTISGNAIAHCELDAGGNITYGEGITINLTGTPNFSGAFAETVGPGKITIADVTFTGPGATGVRYNATGLGFIYTGGGGANYLPGNSPGTTSSGGVYA